MLTMNRIVLFTVAMLAMTCQARQVHFEITNDPAYPQLVSVSNVHYKMATHKYIEVSATLTIHEEISDGTNVSIRIKSISIWRF